MENDEKELSSNPAKRYSDPTPPNGPLYDNQNKQWVDRKTLVPLRDQNPGIPDSEYIGKHDTNDVDDIADGLKKE